MLVWKLDRRQLLPTPDPHYVGQDVRRRAGHSLSLRPTKNGPPDDKRPARRRTSRLTTNARTTMWEGGVRGGGSPPLLKFPKKQRGFNMFFHAMYTPLNKECPFLKTNSKSNSIKMKMKLTQMLLLLLLHRFLPLFLQWFKHVQQLQQQQQQQHLCQFHFQKETFLVEGGLAKRAPQLNLPRGDNCH